MSGLGKGKYGRPAKLPAAGMTLKIIYKKKKARPTNSLNSAGNSASARKANVFYFTKMCRKSLQPYEGDNFVDEQKAKMGGGPLEIVPRLKNVGKGSRR